MKAYRWISCLLITVLLTGLICINLQAAMVGKSLQPGTEAVTKTNAKMYKRHDTGSKKIAKIPKGRTVKIKESATSGWYKVFYKGKTGYLKRKILVHPTEAANYGILVQRLDKKLPLRKKPSAKAASIRTVKAGEYVTILSEKHKKYCKVSSMGYTGYLHKGYFVVERPGKIGDSNTTATTTTLTNLCSSRGTSSGQNVLTKIPKGRTVKVVDENAGWYKVIYNGVTGWVDGVYLKW